MLWFILALTAALSTSANDALAKKFFSHLSAYEMGLIRLLFAFPCLTAGLFLIPRPPLDGVFWRCIAAALPLELAAFLSYMHAIKVSPLSLTIPFLAFTPAFMTVTGRILLGERLSWWGFAGIVLIVAGSYVLNLSRLSKSWSAPFKAVLGEPGSRLMLLTSFLYSVTAALGKLAIQHSSPTFFGAVYLSLFTILLLSIFPIMPGARVRHLVGKPLPAILAGLVLCLMIFSHTLAISMVQAAYMISVKRTSLLFSVVLGAVIFKEERIGERLSGAAVMMAGVFLIGFFG
jgi:drug/metabolite transporter (DMT)-like permease